MSKPTLNHSLPPTHSHNTSLADLFVNTLEANIRYKAGDNAAAAFRAVTEASRNPNSLVRVTFTDIGQVNETVARVIVVLEKQNRFNRAKTDANFKKKQLIVELTNGSGIEFVSDFDKMLENLKKFDLDGFDKLLSASNDSIVSEE